MTFDIHDAPWWTRAVVYQIYPRSFADGNGDGIGDLAGIIAHLDHLQALGIDVLWLSPVYRSPMDDNGYDISDYEDIDPMFGTNAQMDELIAAARERGIGIVMDLVVNHTSDEHAWFIESRSSTDNPKRDWYWWRPPRAGHVGGEQGAEPTNWGSAFSGSAWEYDEASGEYFLHLFSRKQPDLNWENPEVRQAVYAMMRRWLDRGVAGFRMDVINLISKRTHARTADDPGLNDAVVLPGAPYGSGFHEVASGPRLHEFLQEMHREVFAGRPEDLITVGETPGFTIEEALLATNPARREVNMVFQFEHVCLDQGPAGKWDIIPLTLPVLKHSLGKWQTELAENGWNSLYWNNHDQPRAVSRFGDDDPAYRVASAKALGTILHLHRGTPYVYEGEELGMTNTVFAGIEDFRDIESVNHYAEATGLGQNPEDVLAALRYMSRDNARTPMQWDASPHAGFTTGEPWIAANPNHVEINAAAQVDDPDSVFAHYRRLIDLRHDESTAPLVSLGHFRMILAEHPSIYAFTRRLDDQELLVLANCSRADVDVDLSELDDPHAYDGAAVLLSNLTEGGVAGQTAAPNCLGPWEAVILRRP